MSTEWYLQNTRYYSGYEKEEIEETYGVFDELLIQSPEAYQISINGIAKTAIVQSASNYDERRILFKHGDIHWGDIITHEDEKWLVTERPYFNKIHDKSKMQLCNNTLVLYGEAKKVYDGEDELGRPIWEYKQPPKYEYPCVVTNVNSMTADEGEAINLVNDSLILLISYSTNPPIKYGQEFEMYGNSYRIEGIDHRKVIDEKGILMLVVDKIT